MYEYIGDRGPVNENERENVETSGLRPSATVTYSLDDKGDLTIAFDATTSKPTIINMTNHALFDLAGEGAPQGAMPERLTIRAGAYTLVDATLIPTGELRPAAGSVFDFASGRILAQGLRDARDEQIRLGRGHDHNFALDKGHTAMPQLAARLDPGRPYRHEMIYRLSVAK
jgi:aldose 1-epimerase